MKRLEELEKTADGSDAQDNGRVGTEEGTGILIIVAAVVALATLVRVLVLTITRELALDTLAKVLERVAGVFDVLGALDVEGTLDVLERGELDPARGGYVSIVRERGGCQEPGQEDLLSEVAAHGDGAVNPLELGEAVDGDELLVVLDSEAATGPLEQREADVAELVVVAQGNGLARLGEVGGEEVLHAVVLSEKERPGELLEKRNGKALDAANVNVTGVGEAGEGDLELVRVVGDAELLGDVGETGLPVGEEGVVVDREAADGGHVQAVEAGEDRVADADGLDRGDTVGSELDRLEGGQGNPLDLANLLEGAEVDAVEALHARELELAANLLDARAGKGLDARRILDDQVALNGIGAADVDGTGEITRVLEDNITLDGVAVDLGIANRLDLDVLVARLGCIHLELVLRRSRLKRGWGDEPDATLAPIAARARRNLGAGIVICFDV